jgi:hypothetical protein
MHTLLGLMLLLQQLLLEYDASALLLVTSRPPWVASKFHGGSKSECW